MISARAFLRMPGRDSTHLCLLMDRQGLESLGQLSVMVQTKVKVS